MSITADRGGHVPTMPYRCGTYLEGLARSLAVAADRGGPLTTAKTGGPPTAQSRARTRRATLAHAESDRGLPSGSVSAYRTDAALCGMDGPRPASRVISWQRLANQLRLHHFPGLQKAPGDHTA